MQVDFAFMQTRIFKFWIPKTAAKDEGQKVKSVTIIVNPIFVASSSQELILLSATT
jgi:hypothetical protein